MILIADIGNTKIKLAIFDLKKNKITNLFSVETKAKFLEKKIVSFLKEKKIKYALFSSVVPHLFKKINTICKKNKVKTYEVKNKKIHKNIKLNISKKSQVGSDRIVNSISAIKLYRQNSIIVDFGTATTFDIVLSRNIYEGGVISPGIKLSLNSLHKLTANLPLIEIKKQKKIVGKDTISAMNSGVFFGYIHMVNGIIKQIINEQKKSFKIVLTGGYADIFKKHIKPKALVNKNITLIGLAEIAKLNKRLFSEKRK